MLRKKLAKFLLSAVAVVALTACGSNANNNDTPSTTPNTPSTNDTPAPANDTPAGETRLADLGLDENLRFTDTRTITVGLWDRTHERVPEFRNSHWAKWVQEEVLREHNIQVEWVDIPRWGPEDEFQSTLLAANTAPNVSYTFNNPMVSTFAQMGGITNLYPLLQEYGDLLPNMFDLLQENVYWNLDPDTNELYSLTGRLVQDGRLNTFIREDWLNTLGLPAPTTTQEFEETLIAFRDNAELLLGADADKMVPFQIGDDILWTAGEVFESFIPSNMTEREWFVKGFDDRRFHFEEATKAGAKLLNKWYNDGLIWQDFFLYTAGDPIAGDHVKLGYVGAYIQNWDTPFRAADAHITEMRKNTGNPDANYMVITPFQNDAGEVVKFFPNPTDRFIYLPSNNPEPLASLLYIDWISRMDVREYLQFGIEGVHRETQANGAIALKAETDDHKWPDDQFIPSLRNFDITMTVNGIDLGDPELTAATLALGYPDITPEAVMAARAAGLDHARWFRQVNTRPIMSEEGMSVPLQDQRDVMMQQVVAQTAPADFDATFDSLYANYMALGAAAIIAERDQAWVEQFGDVDNRP